VATSPETSKSKLKSKQKNNKKRHLTSLEPIPVLQKAI